MKQLLLLTIFLIIVTLSFKSNAAITEQERGILREKAMEYCKSRGGTWAIWFLVDQGKAQAVCKNGEKEIVSLK